jgi:putative phage associated protein
MTDLTITQTQNAVALAAQQMTQDVAEAHEAMGMIKAFGFVNKLLTVGTLKILTEIKNTKKYKGLVTYIDGKLTTVGSWEQYCLACGFTRQKVDEDLLNLSILGEEFLEESQRLGLGYRDLRKLRKLPEEARAEIVEADYSETADKEELIEKIEDLTAKHAHEKMVLEGQLAQSRQNYEAQSRVLDNKNKRLDQLSAELEKKSQYINTLTPDQKGGELRKETSQLVYGAEAILRGKVWQAFETLDAHSQESGIDHKQFMVGTLAEIELVLNELRTAFNLPQVADGNNVPEWDREDFVPKDYSDEFNAILNGKNTQD